MSKPERKRYFTIMELCTFISLTSKLPNDSEERLGLIRLANKLLAKKTPEELTAMMEYIWGILEMAADDGLPN